MSEAATQFCVMTHGMKTSELIHLHIFFSTGTIRVIGFRVLGNSNSAD